MLTNFQADFLDYIVPDEEFVCYENEEVCISKIGYYLSHGAESRQIAANALGKMEESQTFVHRIKEILDVAV